MSETANITTPAIRALNKLPGVFAMRVNSGKVRVSFRDGDKPRWVHLAPAGFPDILVLSQGRAIGIETKAPGGKVEESQRRMARRLESIGVPVYVCMTPGECVRVVKEWLAGRTIG